jgi:hypothetical protein
VSTTTTIIDDDDHRAVVVTVTSDDTNSHDSIEISSSGSSSSSSRGEYYDIDDHDDNDDDDDEPSPAAEAGVTKFHSAAYGLEEYNNAIVASRDTNVSPREVYDTIASDYLMEAAVAARTAANAAAAQQQQHHQHNNRKQKQQSNKQSIVGSSSSPRALDVGAGAGVSTEILYNMGYHTIDAVDWSSVAWTKYVIEDNAGFCPESVHFYEMDDERYLDQYISNNTSSNNDDEKKNNMLLFDVIVFNFAINKSKALRFASSILNKDHGRLLAPINTNDDYWMKQTYTVLDASGSILWSTSDVGAWSVLFQPDVTQDTCSGIWCSQYNGFQKKQK